jgi:hypothetical protein
MNCARIAKVDEEVFQPLDGLKLVPRLLRFDIENQVLNICDIRQTDQSHHRRPSANQSLDDHSPRVGDHDHTL